MRRNLTSIGLVINKTYSLFAVSRFYFFQQSVTGLLDSIISVVSDYEVLELSSVSFIMESFKEGNSLICRYPWFSFRSSLSFVSICWYVWEHSLPSRETMVGSLRTRVLTNPCDISFSLQREGQKDRRGRF